METNVVRTLLLITKNGNIVRIKKKTRKSKILSLILRNLANANMENIKSKIKSPK